MQLSVKNSNVNESLIQTEAIRMQSPLREWIITRAGNEVTCRVIAGSLIYSTRIRS